MDTNPADKGMAQNEPAASSGRVSAHGSAAPRLANPLSDEPHRRARQFVAAGIGITVFAVDSSTPANIVFAALYVLVLILVGRGAERRHIWYWTAACLLSSAISFALLIDPVTNPSAAANFAIAIVTILCTAALVAQQSAAATIVRRQSRALDVAGTAILLRDRSGEILLWNRAAEELYGWIRDEAVGQNADSLLASRLPDTLEAIHAQLQTRGLWEGEIEHRHRDGHVVTVLSRWTLQSDEGGRPPMIVETDVDAHLQRAAELLRQSELRYRTIFDSLAVAVLEHDFRPAGTAIEALRAQGVSDIRLHIASNPEFSGRVQQATRITGANDTALRMLAATSQEMLSDRFGEIVPSTEECFDQCLVAIAEGQPSFLTETKVRSLTGEWIPAILMLSFPQDGALDRVTGCLVDIRDRVRMQAAIDRARADREQALRAASLGEISASIAHEVNQPLSAIMSYVQASRRWMKREPPNIPEALTAVNDAIMATEHASNVVKRVRTLLGRTEPDRQPFPIDPAISEASRLVRNDANANHVAIQLDLRAEGAIVVGDRVLLQQVLINLFNNAIQAMEGIADREHRVLVETRRDERAVHIRILDSGPGFASGAAEQAFNAFYTTKARGMGLGLAICRSTVEAHGGAIRIDNRPDGPGAVATVELPIGG